MSDAADEDHYIVTSVAFAESFWAQEGCFEVVVERPLGTSSFELCAGEDIHSLLSTPGTGTQLTFRGGPAVYGFGA